MRVAVILPAAGASARFGGPTKKVFAKADGREILLRSVELFCSRKDVCQVLLCIADEDLDFVKSRYGANLGFLGVTLCQGGDSRADTVRRALAQVKAEADFVAVHDAARPAATEALIDAVFAEAGKAGAAIPAVPVTATLKRVSGAGVIDATVPRDGLWQAQTPQVARRELLLSAYAQLGDRANAVTDDAQVLELAGVPVSVVQGDASNVKVTTQDDVKLLEALLKTRPAKRSSTLGAFEEAQW